MNRPTILPSESSDAEILAGVRRHLSESEQLVPQPPRWTRARTVSSVRPVLRSRFSFGGFAPLILIGVVVALAVGYYGLGSRPAGPGAAVPTTNLSGSVMEITYRLVPADGSQPSESDLSQAASVLSKRLSFIFPMMVDASGKPAPGETEAYEVIAAAPDEVVVRFPADYTLVEGSLVMNADWIRNTIGLTGNVELVGLTPTGTAAAGTSNQQVAPVPGSSASGAVALASGADVEGSGFPNTDASTAGPWLRVSFVASPAQRIADYVAQNPGGYLAVLVDGRVFASVASSGALADGMLKIPVSAGLSAEAADTIVLLLANQPPLPTPVTEVSVALIGPSPMPRPSGPESIPTPIVAPTTSPGAQASQYAPSTAGATTAPSPNVSPAAESSPTAASSGAG
jgi:hypothetical protein